MDKETLWEKFRKYINNLSNGDIFYRRDLINEFYGTDIIRRLQFTSIDVYKRCSELNGIIEVLDRGTYMKVNNIPEDISSIEFKSRAYYNPIYKGGSIMDCMDWL